MTIKLFQVDAFTDQLYKGNPAAVCPLPEWLNDDHLQSIAQENNLSETAFYVLNEDPIHIRWFTPTTEVELCGHATLATAHVMRTEMGIIDSPIRFDSQSGPLSVEAHTDGLYTLDFPSDELRDVPSDLKWKACFKKPIVEAKRGKTDYLFVMASQQDVLNETPDFQTLSQADGRGFIITAPGEECDYVSRCFYPQSGIDEDPATGSSQTTLSVYWHDKLDKHVFTARQLSKRGGFFEVVQTGSRTKITGSAVTYLRGEIPGSLTVPSDIVKR